MPRECGTISVSCGRRDDHIDIRQRQPGVTQAVAGRLRCGSGQPLVQNRRLPKSQHISCVVGSDCRLKVVTVIGIIDPSDPT